MKERPILFSAPMVRALLDSTKTQTRRACRVQPTYDRTFVGDGLVIATKNITSSIHSPLVSMLCPYGERGDRLWVREAWSIDCLGAFGTANGYDSTYELAFRADGALREIHVKPGEPDPYLKLYDSQRGDWRPSIHMPRWASRILLEVVSVRVERLQGISDQDVIAEGIGINGAMPEMRCTFPPGETIPRTMYRALWESINGAGSWDANPWVWVVEFKRVTP